MNTLKSECINTLKNNDLTIVSGYWIVKNKHGNKFVEKWFKNTLKINCPYVFFGDRETIEIIKPFRTGFQTYYIELNINDFKTHKYYDMIGTHPVHCVTKELNMIWNEKIYLVHRASEVNPFNTNYFAWADAGLCVYRNKAPPCKIFPNEDKLCTLPLDKFIFCSSDDSKFNHVAIGGYYHYVSGTYVMHRSMIEKFTEIWTKYLDKYLVSGSYLHFTNYNSTCN